MNLVQVTYESIIIGQPLSFSLRDETGALLASKGFVIVSREDLEAVRGRGQGFYVDVSESEQHQKAFVGKLHALVRDERTLGKIAQVSLSTGDLTVARNRTLGDELDWLDLQVQGNRLLRDLDGDHFVEALERLQKRLSQQSRRNPDGALFALFHLATSEIQLYSATHSMLVSVMCGLAARDVLGWPQEMEDSLCKAALTMNISMTDLQDRLAAQNDPPTPAQRELIEHHASRSQALLRSFGLNDPDCLEAVRHHHGTGPGALAPRTQGQRMARLLQRADKFAAHLSPRASRRPGTAAAAMQAIYFDEERATDEAGAALIKAVGVYSPGTLVRLNNQEIGIVVRRGANTTMPRVAVLANSEGLATGEHAIRDTSMRDYRIVAGVARGECKVTIHLDRMLALTAGPTASSRAW
jgi:HD-GYP domain-containing protein (c-di-GMP phosphodiesterase class II)